MISAVTVPLTLLIVGAAECVPARWPSSELKTLELLRGTPVNCIIVPRIQWSAGLREAAEKQGVRVFGSIRTPNDLAAAPGSGLTAFVVEGAADEKSIEELRGRAEVVEIASRERLLSRGASRGAGVPVFGTSEALWPGIRLQDASGKAHAAPSGGPWIDTNGGFLRFARAVTGASIWVAADPPSGLAVTAEQSIAAAADAYAAGARWIVSLDADLQKRLFGGDVTAVKQWETLCSAIRFFEEKRPWTQYPPSGMLGIVQDVESGAALTGGLMDMFGSRHTPARIIPTRSLTLEKLKGVSLLVNIEPGSTPAETKETLRAFTRGGGHLFNGPPDWHFPDTGGYVLALDKLPREEIDHFDLIWRQLTSQTWNKNLGARLFNVSSILSSLSAAPDGSRTCLFLVNYSGHAAESITVYVPGAFSKAALHAPGEKPRPLETYSVEEGTGIDIPRIGVVGIVELTP
jgi:hypothetical protein